MGFLLVSSKLTATLFNLSHTIMAKSRVLLISSQCLFGESMETILRANSDIELIGSWNLNDPNVPRQLLEANPSVVVIADENLQSEAAAEMTKLIVERHPDLSVIRTGLSENVLRVFSTHTRSARGSNLFDTIRECALQNLEANERNTLKLEMDGSVNLPPSKSGVRETHE